MLGHIRNEVGFIHSTLLCFRCETTILQLYSLLPENYYIHHLGTTIL